MRKLSIFCLLIFVAIQINAQSLSSPVKDSFSTNNVTIHYQLSITQNNKKGIAETYNGAIKSFYTNHSQARIRFVSLMRSQNIFMSTSSKNQSKNITITKEVGKAKYKMLLNNEQWNVYNSNYQNSTVSIENDSLLILEKLCKKAIVHTKDKEEIIVWYVPNTDNTLMAQIEPMFTNIPGVVLQYEYHQKKKSIIFTAIDISFLPIPANQFTIPTKGYSRVKFATGKAIKKELEVEEEE